MIFKFGAKIAVLCLRVEIFPPVPITFYAFNLLKTQDQIYHVNFPSAYSEILFFKASQTEAVYT